MGFWVVLNGWLVRCVDTTAWNIIIGNKYMAEGGCFEEVWDKMIIKINWR